MVGAEGDLPREETTERAVAPDADETAGDAEQTASNGGEGEAERGWVGIGVREEECEDTVGEWRRTDGLGKESDYFRNNDPCERSLLKH